MTWISAHDKMAKYLNHSWLIVAASGILWDFLQKVLHMGTFVLLPSAVLQVGDDLANLSSRRVGSLSCCWQSSGYQLVDFWGIIYPKTCPGVGVRFCPPPPCRIV